MALVTVSSLLIAEPSIDARLEAVAARIVGSDGKAIPAADVALAFGTAESGRFRFGSFRGREPFYPASVVKLFYLACLEEKIASGRVALTPELGRARRDMIVDSNNDATALVLDTITGTTGGPELPPRALAEWKKKRQEVNRWLAARGFVGVNACQKPWNEGPYGRERQSYGPKMEGANSLTAESCLGMMAGIVLASWHKPEATTTMMSLLRRVPASERTPETPTDEQSTLFTGAVVPRGWKLWSKAGWTSKVSHDVAMVETPSGRRHILVVFTRGHASDVGLVPRISRAVLAACAPEFPPEG